MESEFGATVAIARAFPTLLNSILDEQGAEVGVVDGESARVLREHLEKLKASITNLEKRMPPP